MPTAGTITISLQSQYNGTTLQEHSATHVLEPQESTSPPTSTQDRSPSSADVFIETNSASQFWINYSCAPPPAHSATRYYYFKLFVKNTCLVSWCTSAAEGWHGRVMHGLFDGGTDFLGRHTIKEKRALQFPKKGSHECYFEIKVYRSNARRREKPRYQMPKGTVPGAGDVATTKIGEVKSDQPQRMYSFALLDPVDRPFSTLRYHHRSYEQLVQLGVLEEQDEMTKKDLSRAPRSPTKDSQSTNPQTHGSSVRLVESDDGSEDDEEELGYRIPTIPTPLPEGVGLKSSPSRIRSRSVVHQMPVIEEDKRLSAVHERVSLE